MAVTINRYNHSLKLMLNKEVDYSGLKLMLLDDAASFDATDTDIEDVAGADNVNEVAGNGWTAGGEFLAGVAISVVDTDGAMLDATDLSVEADGGPIGPAEAAVIYDAASNAPLWYIDFGGAQTAGTGTDFKVTWAALGIQRVTDPA